MNSERVKKLLDHIKKSPDEQFHYGNWFSGIDDKEISTFRNVQEAAKNRNKKSICGTAACVAGHACLLFWKETRKDLAIGMSIAEIAQNVLELDHQTRYNLFLQNMDDATKADAIKRLEYLLQFGNLDDYDWFSESKYNS